MTFEDFTARFEHKKPYQRGFMVPCPGHDDNPKTPSLAVSRANDGGILLKCFAGCSSEQIVKSLGLELKDLFAKEHRVYFEPPNREYTQKTNCGENIKPVIDKIYSYENYDGQEVFQVLRMRPKTFRQRHMKDGGWVYNMDGVTRVLYHLPEISKADTIFVCEGEKDVDNLFDLGYTATCNVGGAGKWFDGYTSYLNGKDIILCGDNDEPGKKHIDLVFKSVCETAKTVKILKLPNIVKDVSDFIATFKTKSEAKSAIDALVSNCYPHVKGEELPIYRISEFEPMYKSYVAGMDHTAFHLSKWLPSMSRLRPLVPGELVVVIGDTGTGKTGVAQSIARAAMPMTTVLFELELPRELMFERFVSMVTGFTGGQVEDAYRSFPNESQADMLNEKYKNLYVCPKPRLTVEQIERFIIKAELKTGEKTKVVVIDYVQLLSADGPNRREKIADIMEGLKVVAVATQTIIFVISQISRPPNLKEDQVWVPNLHSGKESSSIEASCGLLMGLWRGGGGELFVKILKSTKGGAGLIIPCNFDGACMKITEQTQQH